MNLMAQKKDNNKNTLNYHGSTLFYALLVYIPSIGPSSSPRRGSEHTLNASNSTCNQAAATHGNVRWNKTKCTRVVPTPSVGKCEISAPKRSVFGGVFWFRPDWRIQVRIQWMYKLYCTYYLFLFQDGIIKTKSLTRPPKHVVHSVESPSIWWPGWSHDPETLPNGLLLRPAPSSLWRVLRFLLGGTPSDSGEPPGHLTWYRYWPYLPAANSVDHHMIWDRRSHLHAVIAHRIWGISCALPDLGITKEWEPTKRG